MQTNLNVGIGVLPPTQGSDLNLQAGGVDKTSVKSAVLPESMLAAGLQAGDTLMYPRFGQNSVVVNELGANRNSNHLTQTDRDSQLQPDLYIPGQKRCGYGRQRGAGPVHPAGRGYFCGCERRDLQHAGRGRERPRLVRPGHGLRRERELIPGHGAHRRRRDRRDPERRLPDPT